MGNDELSARLTYYRERGEREIATAQDVVTRHSGENILALVAALEAALKLADRARGVHWGGRYLGWDLDPADLREAITAALTGEPVPRT
jgi:hypothetical protein